MFTSTQHQEETNQGNFLGKSWAKAVSLPSLADGKMEFSTLGNQLQNRIGAIA